VTRKPKISLNKEKQEKAVEKTDKRTFYGEFDPGSG
jgi:hypothetical protein